jgi:hypothetical protein
LVETLRDIEGNHLLRWAVATICAAVFAAVSCVDHHGLKGLARVLDLRSPHGCARWQQREKRNYNDTIYQVRHSNPNTKKRDLQKSFSQAQVRPWHYNERSFVSPNCI